MMVAIGIGLLASILSIAATNSILFIVAGAFAGLANTMICLIASLWQAENAEAHNRGRKVVLLYLSAAVGYALASWIGFAFFMTSVAAAAFRGVMSLQIIFFLLALVFIYFATDSYR